MEYHPIYNLNAAVENWRLELHSQPNLTGEDRRELETHLWDAITELRERGLNEEESFWLARRRLGPPHELAAEFIKANPGKTWRERVFWGVIFVLIFQLWTSTANILPLWFHVTMKYNLVWLQSLLSFVFAYAPLIYFVKWVSQNEASVSSVFKRRSRFVFAAIGVLVTRLLVSAATLHALHHSDILFDKKYLLPQLIAVSVWLLIFMGLIALLHPERCRKAAA